MSYSSAGSTVDNLSVLYSNAKSGTKGASTRYIPQDPDRVLDAPELMDDYCKLCHIFIFILVQFHWEPHLEKNSAFRTKYQSSSTFVTVFEFLS